MASEVYLAFISFYSSNHEDNTFLTLKKRTTQQQVAILRSSTKQPQPENQQHLKKESSSSKQLPFSNHSDEKVLIKTESGISYSITLNNYCLLNTYLLPYVGSFSIRRVPNGPCLRFHQKLFNINRKTINKKLSNDDGDEVKGRKGNCYGSVKYKYSTLLKYLKENDSCQDKVLLYSFLCKKIEEEYERRDFYDIDEFIHSPECCNHSEESMREYLNENYYYGPIELLKKLEESACSWISYSCSFILYIMEGKAYCKDMLTYLSSFPRNAVPISDKKIEVSAKCIRDLVSELMYFSIGDTNLLKLCSFDFCGRMQHFFHKSDTTYPMDMFLIDPFDLISAVEYQSIEKFKLFLSKPWTDINQVRQDGETALSMAFKQNDNQEILKKLLKLPKINVNKTGNTLHHACKSSELFNQLLESGHSIDVNKIYEELDFDCEMMTFSPLEIACCYENYDVVLKLLAHNADVRQIAELWFDGTSNKSQQEQLDEELSETLIVNNVPTRTDKHQQHNAGIGNEIEQSPGQADEESTDIPLGLAPIYPKFANLILSYNFNQEGTFGWYLHQLLTKHSIGNQKFPPKQKRKLIQFGFGEKLTTSPNWFGFFRKFNNIHCRQSNCESFPLEDSRTYFSKNHSQGIYLDANIEHYEYKDRGLGLAMSKGEEMVRRRMDRFMSENQALLTDDKLSEQFDEKFGLKMWLAMRPLNILLNNEANALSEVEKSLNNESGHMDMSMCWSRKCSIWTTYFYTKMDLEFKERSSKKVPKNCICSFISNCVEERLKVVREINATVPVTQYGTCERNAKEGKGGKIQELADNCKFYMAFENTLRDDYITEKFFEGFMPLGLGGKTISIYRGAFNVGEYGFEKNSFLNFHDFKTPTELAQFIKPYCKSNKLFSKLFKQRMDEKTKKSIKEMTLKLHLANVIKSPCKLCTAIGEMKISRYILFKLGLKPKHYRVNSAEFTKFIDEMGYDKLEADKWRILWDIWDRAYGRLIKPDNNQSNWNDYDISWVTYVKDQ